MSNYFGTGLDQAPLNEQLGEAAYWDLRQLSSLVNGVPKIITSNHYAIPFQTIHADTSSQAITIYLNESPQVGDSVRIMSWDKSWMINQLSVDARGGLIMGKDEVLIINVNQLVQLTYTSEKGWVIT